MQKIEKILEKVKNWTPTQVYFTDKGINRSIQIAGINSLCLGVPIIIELLIGSTFFETKETQINYFQMLIYLILLGVGLKHMPELKTLAPVLFTVNAGVNYFASKYNFKTVLVPEGYTPNSDQKPEDLVKVYSQWADYSTVLTLMFIS